MAELPTWTWYLLAFLGASFVLGYLRALAAAAEDTLSVHRLRHEAASLQIRQFKQLKAIQLGVHPGDIFTSDARLDRMIAEAEGRIAGEKATEANQPRSTDAPGDARADGASETRATPETDQSTDAQADPGSEQDTTPGVAGTVPGPDAELAPARQAA